MSVPLHRNLKRRSKPKREANVNPDELQDMTIEEMASLPSFEERLDGLTAPGDSLLAPAFEERIARPSSLLESFEDYNPDEQGEW